MSIKGFDPIRPDDVLGFLGSFASSRRLSSLVYGGSLAESATLKAAIARHVFGSTITGSWPASAASAASIIGFGASWDAGYSFNVASGNPTNDFGATALTSLGTVAYGRQGPFTSGGDKAVTVRNAPPEIREDVDSVAGTLNPSTTALTQIGDLVVSIFMGDAPTLQSGFTAIVAPFGTSMNMAVAYKVAASAGAVAYQAYTLAGGVGSASLVVLKVGTFDVTRIASATASVGASTDPNPPAVTLYDSGTLVLIAGGAKYSASTSAIMSVQSPYLALADQGGSATYDQGSGYRIIGASASGATEDPPAITGPASGINTEAHSVTIAFGGETRAAGLAASSTPFDVTSGDITIAWLAWVGEGSAPASGYIVDKLSATAGYAVEVIQSGGVPVIKFSVDSTALNTVTCDVQRGQWHAGIATYVGATGVMTVGTKSLGGSVSTATATDASHSGVTSAETFRAVTGRGDLMVRGLLLGASGAGVRVGTLNTTANMATALESLRQSVLVTAMTAYTAGIAETVNLSEQLAAIFATSAAPAETMTLSEALGVIRGGVIAAPESVALGEAIAALYSAIAAPAESMTVAEAVAVIRASTVGLAEGSSLSEALAVTFAAIAGVSESSALAELLSVSFGMVAAIAETLVIGDSVAASYAAAAGPAETVTLSEAIAILRSCTIAPAETLALAEALAVIRDAVASAAETVNLSEQLASLASFYALPVESLALAEALAAGLLFTATASESVALSEQLTALRAAIVAIGESPALAESIGASMGASLTLVEATAIGESVGATRAVIVGLDDATSLLESISASAGLSVSLDDAAAIAEALAASAGFSADMLESLTLAEAIGLVLQLGSGAIEGAIGTITEDARLIGILAGSDGVIVTIYEAEPWSGSGSSVPFVCKITDTTEE